MVPEDKEKKDLPTFWIVWIQQFNNSNVNWNNIKTNRKTTINVSWKQTCKEKLEYGRIFKAENNEIALLDTVTEGNPKKETEFHLVAAQGNAIRRKYIKAKIDYAQ